MKILIIEDDPGITEYISIAFKIGWPDASLLFTHEGKTGFELILSESPALIILDIELPDTNGFDVLKNIRTVSQVPVIIETVRDSEADIAKGLELGADDYIVKPYGQIELLARCRAVLRRAHMVTSADQLIFGDFRMDTSSGLLFWNNKQAHLTHTEAEILKLLVGKAGKTATHLEIAECIWGDDYPDSTEAIRVYIQRLRKKIEILSATKLIHTSSGIGYRFNLST
jgi:two-component system KDP operon response regulator KdpE